MTDQGRKVSTSAYQNQIIYKRRRVLERNRTIPETWACLLGLIVKMATSVCLKSEGRQWTQAWTSFRSQQDLLKEKRTNARASSTANNLEDKEAWGLSASFINNLLANCDNGGKVRQIIINIIIIPSLCTKGPHHIFFLFCILYFKTTHTQTSYLSI
jgi:hypothetical protein